MKSKQLNPKSVRPMSTNSPSNVANKQRVRCSLCDTLLKASTTHRYLLMGKSIHDNIDKNLTYGDCCERYLNGSYESDKLHMICPKCCHNLQEVYSLHKNAEKLTEKIRHSWYKTKRLNRARHLPLNISRINETISSTPISTNPNDDNIIISVKEELEIEQTPSDMNTKIDQLEIPVPQSIPANIPYDLSNTARIYNNHHQGTKKKPRVVKQTQSPSNTTRKSHLMESFPSSFAPVKTSRSEFSDSLLHSTTKNQVVSPYAQLMIESPSSSSSSSHPQQSELRQRNNSNSEPTSFHTNYEPSIDGDQSLSPHMNDDEAPSTNGTKNARLSRRQYDFLVKLPDQQSLNAFIETSASESGSRWTWRRTSANSRGYKVYYVCNFSMRRHYHPCPAAMYALFHPEGSISIFSCGQHQHIPKDRLPVSITDATKDEIFKCLQSGMATTDIREHLTRLQLPFGDTRKLNNFIKYHKELLRFGTVTNVRVGGTAYRQPQCWAIRRQPSAPPQADN